MSTSYRMKVAASQLFAARRHLDDARQMLASTQRAARMGSINADALCLELQREAYSAEGALHVALMHFQATYGEWLEVEMEREVLESLPYVPNGLAP